MLNWGLGHATRTVPVVRELLAAGHRPVLASDGRALRLLRNEFPHLDVRELPAYNVRYGRNLVWSMVRQVPKLLRAVRAERRAVADWVAREHFTHLISDNRYGCHHAALRSALLTHQINIAVPNRLFAGVNHWNRHLLRQFDQIWVPDHPPGSDSLAGKLAEPHPRLPPVRHLGPLSRLVGRDVPKRYALAAVVSGPEPSRTEFATYLRRELPRLEQRCALVLGQPERTDPPSSVGMVDVFPFRNTTQLNRLLNESAVVLSRAGYSSIMDYETLGLPAILVPTPGQTEQEYLARHFAQTGRYVTSDLTTDSLSELLERARRIPPRAVPVLKTPPLRAVLEDFLK